MGSGLISMPNHNPPPVGFISASTGTAKWTSRRKDAMSKVPPESPPMQHEIKRKLSPSLSTCGCDEGAALGLLYLIGILAWLIAGGGSNSLVQWCLVLVGFCMTVTAGKLAGIGLARLRLSPKTRSMGNFTAGEKE